MPNLRSYEREALLALPAGAELDELVHGVLGRMGHAPQYSKDVMLVGVMLARLPKIFIGTVITTFRQRSQEWCISMINHNTAMRLQASEFPHVCALALVLAAWEKERGQ